jgi:hypothetical protein
VFGGESSNLEMCSPQVTVAVKGKEAVDGFLSLILPSSSSPPPSLLIIQWETDVYAI